MRKLFKDYLNEISETELYEQYITHNLSVKECASHFNVGQSMLMRILKQYKIKKPKDAHTENIKKSKLEKYGYENYNNRNKAKQTCVSKYGVENVFQSEAIKAKSEQTRAARYSNAHFVNPEKNKQTKINKYGSLEKAYQHQVSNYTKTCLERYGVINAALIDEVRAKISKTQRNNWVNLPIEEKAHIANKISKSNKGRVVWNKGRKIGPISADKKIKILAKQYETKKNNGSFNTSLGENYFYEKLLTLFLEEDVIRQYSTDPRYPFSCDFYIKSKDLFIELNYSWTHGMKPFEETEQDLKKLASWQAKAEDSKYYKNAIETWTRRDVAKFSAARENNLNYLVYYSEADAENNITKDIENLKRLETDADAT